MVPSPRQRRNETTLSPSAPCPKVSSSVRLVISSRTSAVWRSGRSGAMMLSTYIAVVAAEFRVTAASISVVTKAPTIRAAKRDTVPPATTNWRASDCWLHRSRIPNKSHAHQDDSAREIWRTTSASMQQIVCAVGRRGSVVFDSEVSVPSVPISCRSALAAPGGQRVAGDRSGHLRCPLLALRS